MKFAIENPENKLYVLCVLYGYFQERNQFDGHYHRAEN
jgi:hypothetical protein